jgi:hypothetical protein
MFNSLDQINYRSGPQTYGYLLACSTNRRNKTPSVLRPNPRDSRPIVLCICIQQTLNCGNASPASFFFTSTKWSTFFNKTTIGFLITFTATSQRNQTLKYPTSDHLRPEYLFSSNISPPTRTMNYANMNNSGMNHSNMNNNSGMNNSGMQGQRTGAAGKGPDFICKSKSSLLPMPTTP